MYDASGDCLHWIGHAKCTNLLGFNEPTAAPAIPTCVKIRRICARRHKPLKKASYRFTVAARNAVASLSRALECFGNRDW